MTESKNYRKLLVAGIAMVTAIIFTTTAVFAWFSNFYKIIDNIFTPGKLDPEIEINYWDKTNGGWISISDNSGFVDVSLGEMNDITKLPDNCEIYLKINVNENSTAKYNYIAYIENIDIEIISKLTIPQMPIIVEGIDYFDATPSQQCFEYSYAVGADNLNAQSISYKGEYRITEKGQPLLDTSGELVKSNEYLYVKIAPVLSELQNILKCVSMDYMPYTIKFILKIQGESRTLNYEN